MNELAEIIRRLNNVIRLGVVTEVDTANHLARVESGDNETDWLRYSELNAAHTKTHNPPEKGETWVILSPGGELENGILVVRLPTDDNAPPSTSDHERGIEYKDGTRIFYNSDTHTLAVDVPENGALNITVNGHCSINASTIDLGVDNALQPSVLGNALADALEDLISQINSAQVIGNLGAPSSPIMAVTLIEVMALLRGGAAYSTKNRNQ